MQRYRSVFISDVHLGTRMSQAGVLLEFIKTLECDRMYLVGDIIDGWAMRRSFYWPQQHNDVIQKLMRLARKGVQITYISGNHDEFMRSFGDHHFGNIELSDSAAYVDLQGRTYLVMHGDQFDAVIKNMKWLSLIGSWAYDLSIKFNILVSKIRDVFGLPYWSLSAWAKYKVKQAVNFISDYEENLTSFARTKDVQGIICGHIHHANIRDIQGIAYMNCGDWVESCTALVEHLDGRWEIIRYEDIPRN